MAKRVRGEDGKLYKVKKPFYEKVWFWILVVILVAAVGGSLGGNSKDKNSAEKTSTSSKEATSTSDKTSEKASSESQAPKEESKSADEQYQAILDEYTQKIKEAAPKLVDEYNAEYPNNQNGVEGLAELSNDKISELAEISNEGIQEMANVHLTSGSGKYEDYEDWATKLTDVYMEQAELITDAYMTSAQ